MMALDGTSPVGVHTPGSLIGLQNNLNLDFAVLPGDVNGDGVVNSQDEVLIRNQIQGTGNPALIPWADVNGDGVVNITDYNLVKDQVGTQLPGVRATSALVDTRDSSPQDDTGRQGPLRRTTEALDYLRIHLMKMPFDRCANGIRWQQTSGRSRSRLVAGLLAGLSALACGPTAANADFVMSIGDYEQTSALSGTFEVTLSNTDPTTYYVAGFSFELMLPSSSGIQFTGASTATVANPYIFNGTGSATIDPGFVFSYDSFPNTSFTASDTEFTYSSIAIASGSSFGLGLVSYTISPNAPPGSVPISFVSDGTSLSDADGNAISFTTQGGSIRANAIPEPSSFVLLITSAAALAASRRCVRTGPSRATVVS